MSQNSIRTCALIGAGAVGSYFIYCLSDKMKENFSVVASGDRAKRLKTGIVINGKTYYPNIKRPEEVHGVDLLLVAVKYRALESILPDLTTIIDKDHTIVLSLLNGVNSEDVIRQAIHPKNLVWSFMKIQSTRTKDSVIFDPERTLGLYYGIPGFTNEKDNPVLSNLSAFLSATSIRSHFCPDILSELWGKFYLNVTSNLPQAVIDVGVGALEDSPYLKHIADGLGSEVIKIAEAKGISISSVLTGPVNSRVAEKSAAYSTLQDLRAGRQTEVDVFSGEIIRMGRELGIATPYNEVVYDFIKALEEKNEGKFDYKN
ncbi:MAG: 2-dehydropantoate 2-reductase [Lachnospiraceae bacterium]|nr:2-dehydropantoate 2-reductase [Lachnospiraceae bacterium]MDD6450482.1 2-dehydropantoate 2-reductase [Lachnospiraceae bacterium]